MKKNLILLLCLGLLVVAGKMRHPQFDKSFYADKPAWATYDNARERYGYPPYAGRYWSE